MERKTKSSPYKMKSSPAKFINLQFGGTNIKHKTTGDKTFETNWAKTKVKNSDL